MESATRYWEENPATIQRVKYESCNSNDEAARIKDDRGLYPCCDTNLNFSTATCSEDDCDYGPYKKNKVTRQDPMSHRIIEKRRRDRMNNCLADLSRLIPTEYLKKGRGRIEKTEIIEMAIKHMKYLQQEHSNPLEQYRLGYQECMSEAMRFMVEIEGHFPRESICVRLLGHLQKHCDSLSRSTTLNTTINNSTAPTDHSPTLIPNNNNNNNVHNNNSKPDDRFNNTTNGHHINRQLIPDYDNAHAVLTKMEPEIGQNGANNGVGVIIKQIHDSDGEKQSDSNGVSYKYKNNIKMRFNQDLCQEGASKRQKLENGRRSSFASTENQSSSHSSPPSGTDLCARMSDNDLNRHSPSDNNSILSTSSNLKSEYAPPTQQLLLQQQQQLQHRQRFSPLSAVKNTSSVTHYSQFDSGSLKHQNFNVPIFVLHAKGSYYIPLTIDYKTLLPFLQNFDILDVMPISNSFVLHPVTINVNFQPANNGNNVNKSHSNNWHQLIN